MRGGGPDFDDRGVGRGTAMRVGILAGLLVVVFGGGMAVAAGDEGREIPAPFAPFEHLIGSWKGQGIPAANKLKGWPETHLWAWKFAKGVPVGMSIELKGDKALTKVDLTADADGKRYRLEGTDAEGKPVAYAGPYGGASSSKMLTLDRVGDTPGPEGKERIVIWPYGNMIRYALWLERQDPGAPQFKRIIEVGLTKEGEAFAAGGSAADLPRCIITGGSAPVTSSDPGKAAPIRRGGLGRRPAQVHHHRRFGLDDELVPGQVVSDLLLGLPRRVQRQPRKVRQEGRAAGRTGGEQDACQGRLLQHRQGRRRLRRLRR